MIYMIYIRQYQEIKENVLNTVPAGAEIRELDRQDALCILGDRDTRDKTVNKIKQSLDVEKRCRILPVKCMIESASRIELVLHDGETVSFAKRTHR